MTVSATTRLKVSATTTTTVDAGSVVSTEEFSQNVTWTDGTGANQVEQVWSDTRTLAGSASEDLDLAGGITDAQGNTVTFTAVKSILIKGDSANGDDIEVGGASSNQFVGPFKDTTDIQTVPAGGAWYADNPSAAGWTVTASTGDLLKVANADASSASYSIEILGLTS